MWAIFFLASAMLAGADWPQYRGVHGMGLSLDRNLPVEFGVDRNVVWKTALPPGHSSPILAGSRIFLTAYEGETLLTFCLDRRTGKVLWRREAPRPRKENFQKTNSPASPSPVSDGRTVYVFFGDFGMLAYGMDGEEKWRRPMGPFNNVNGHGSSPIVAGDLLVLICDQDTDSYVIAMDKNTGKTVWKVDRPEVTRGYATPAVYQPSTGGVKEVIVPGAYQLISYELATGKKLWWVNGMAWQLKCVPVIDGDTIYINAWETGGDFETPPAILTWEQMLAKYDKNGDKEISLEEAPDHERWMQNNDLNFNKRIEGRDWEFWILHRTAQNSVLAVRPAGKRGDLTKEVIWRYRKSLPNVPSPLLVNGALFLVKDGGVVTTLNPATGEVYKQARVPEAIEQYWASPVSGDGKVYLVSQACKVSVLKAEPQWEVLRMNDLNDDCFATPALADGGIYLRTRGWMYFFRQ